VINLDAVVSVSAGEEQEGFVCRVRYRVPGTAGVEDGFAFEKFVGDDAEKIFKYLVDCSRCVDLSQWIEWTPHHV
jgi:hypothetical protein